MISHHENITAMEQYEARNWLFYQLSRAVSNIPANYLQSVMTYMLRSDQDLCRFDFEVYVCY